MRKLFDRISFRNKIIIIFVIMVLVPLGISTLVFYSYSRKNMEGKTRDYLQGLASVTMSKIEMSIQNVEDISFFIAGNEKMQMILADDDSGKDRAVEYQQYSEAKDLLSYYVLLSNEISSIYIQSVDGRTFSYTKKNQSPHLDELQNMESNWKCLDGHIYLKRNLYQFPTQKLLGYMVTELESPIIYNIVKDIFDMADSKAFIVDEDHNIIAGWKQALTGQKIENEFLDSEAQLTTGFYRTNLNGEVCSIYVGDAIHNGWRFVLMLPESYYMQDIWTLQYFTMSLIAITSLVAISLIVIVGRSLTKPLHNLTIAMENVGQGNFNVVIPVERSDEIGMLSRTFNQMVQDMKMLIDNVYEKERMKQEVEMKSLQMQINPHFLYNTLDTINWMARMRGVDEVGEMTSALGNLMRYSLSKRDFVTIEEELKNLKDYIGIQNVRYGDKMSIELQVDDAVRQYYIPKLLIQPILENAIVHGVEDKLEQSFIQIRVYQENNNLFAIVEDDGVGMTQEAIESLMNIDYHSHKSGHTSIGVYNVNRRIQAVFGKDCGLQIQSQLGAGTKITLRMKILKIVPDMHLKYN
ncbi:MAG: histidine kinase [Eubacteriales bacterium]|nr:histidine kinase [Eubacteriales bacterium]